MNAADGETPLEFLKITNENTNNSVGKLSEICILAYNFPNN